MTGTERMRAAILGLPVDRVPIWLREGFDFTREPGTTDVFGLEWQSDPAYRQLWDFARQHCDMRIGWSPGGHFNRFLSVPPSVIRTRVLAETADFRRVEGTIDTPKGKLCFLIESRKGVHTSWMVKPPVESLDDLEKLRSVPFEVEPVTYESYERARSRLGHRGILCLGLSSPCVVISHCLPFQLFLEWSLAERALMHELLEEVTQRILACLEEVFARPVDTTANIGGSEQCTPPMMGPDAYDEYVTPYDRRIVAFLKSRGVPVNCHCHGRVRNALSSMVEAGFDSTDPVEPPPAGDVSIAQARQIVGDHLTLVGNFEFDELETSSPEQVRERVREILATGKRRLILAASAGPISRMSPRLIKNYYAWIETALEYGGCDAPNPESKRGDQ